MTSPTLVGLAFLVVHLGAFLVGGTLAIRTDRATRGARSPGERLRHLGRLARAHRVVMRSIWASVASGVVLFALASDRYVTSGTFWIKMALFGALLANGLVMQVAERDAREALGVTALESASADGTAFTSAWSRIGATSVASTLLWLLVAAAGFVLTVAGWYGSR